MKRVDYDNSISTCYQEYSSIWIEKAVLDPPAKTGSGPIEASKLEFFMWIVNGFK